MKDPTRCYEDFQTGQTWTTPPREITQALVMEFARSTGDTNSLHTDPDVAKKSLFGRQVAHGLLVLSVAVGQWMKVGLLGVAFSGIDKVRFLKPVFFGDVVHAKMAVTAVEDRGDYGLVVLHNDVVNQKGETVLVFDARLALPHRRT